MTKDNISKIRILFVDDDRDVLDGFKRVLFKMRKEWEMEFVTDGEVALEKMEKISFDAVVSDIGMSGITGDELFRVVKENHPEVARIVISGSAGLENLVKSLGFAHQFLLKPVNAEHLKETLTRVVALRNFLKDKNIKKVINKIDSLPNQPEMHQQLTDAMESGSIKEIADIIKKNPAIATKILQLVNSPFWGVKNRIEDISHAVTLIGIDVLRALVLTLEIFSKFRISGDLKEELDALFNHSYDVAQYAYVIAREMTKDKTMANESYISGLLHDVGKLIILSYFPQSYFEIRNILNSSKGEPFQQFQVEQEILKVNHSQLGAYLLGLWGLPEFLVETTAYHHNLGDCLCKDFSPVSAVHIADAIKNWECNADSSKTQLPLGLDEEILEHLEPGIVDRIPEFVGKINEIKETPLA